MRIYGVRVPPALALFARFRAREFRAWPRESFLRLGSVLYVRAWSMESLPRLSRLFGNHFHPENLVDLKIWKRWWMAFSRETDGSAVLTCEPYGRFGNRIVQAAAGVAAAKALGAAKAMLRTDDFLNGISGTDLSGVQLAAVTARGQRLQVEGRRPYPALIVEANWLLSQPAFVNRGAISAGFSLLRGADLVQHQQNTRELSELVVHFRGTDMLTRDWRPPPLAFFVKAAQHSKAKSLVLVTDDPSNSLVVDLLARFATEGFVTRVQSQSLEEDSQTLLSATTLCFGVGTFASSFAGLSKNLRVAYSWSQPDWSTWAHFGGSFDLRPDLENFQIFDASRTYIAPFDQEKGFSNVDVAAHVSRFQIENLEVRRIAPTATP